MVRLLSILRAACLETVVLTLFWLTATVAPLAAGELVIENYDDGDTMRCSVVVLKGRIDGMESGRAVVENLSSALPSRIVVADVCEGRFRLPVELVDGTNDLSVSVGDQRVQLALVLRRSASPYVVRIAYFTGRQPGESETETSLTTLPDSLVRRRLETAGNLWQTAIAERLSDQGYGRRTFTLERDGEGRSAIWSLCGKQMSRDYLAMDPEERFRVISREIAALPDRSDKICWFVCVALDEDAKDSEDDGNSYLGDRRKQRTELGDLGIAMLDARCLDAWPESLEDALERFADARPIPHELARDSAFRNTRWALSASSLGAGLHELGHAFGLGHSNDSRDVMNRGFDRFNRVFTSYEPPSDISDGGAVGEEDQFYWSRASVERLLRSKWIEE